MLVLLPPSEGKTSPATGDPVDLTSLSHPELADARRRVGDTLARVSGQRNEMSVLGAGASLADEVARNATLWSNPAGAAARVYTGVLYDAAGMSAWDDAVLARGSDRIRIVSALWGAVSPTDRIPAYRLSMGTTLGRIGALAPFWRRHLSPALDGLADGGLVVDCRSSSYAAAWKPTDAVTFAVRVERELNGRRSVVSHSAKHTRGLLTAHLMAAAETPETPTDLADAAAGMIGGGLVDVSLGDGVLTLVVT